MLTASRLRRGAHGQCCNLDLHSSDQMLHVVNQPHGVGAHARHYTSPCWEIITSHWTAPGLGRQQLSSAPRSEVYVGGGSWGDNLSYCHRTCPAVCNGAYPQATQYLHWPTWTVPTPGDDRHCTWGSMETDELWSRTLNPECTRHL